MKSHKFKITKRTPKGIFGIVKRDTKKSERALERMNKMKNKKVDFVYINRKRYKFGHSTVYA